MTRTGDAEVTMIEEVEYIGRRPRGYEAGRTLYKCPWKRRTIHKAIDVFPRSLA